MVNKFSSASHLAVIYALFFILIGLAYMFSIMLHVPIEHFSADPAMTYQAHPFTGFLSNIGVLIWAFTATICLFSYVVIIHNEKNTHSNYLLFAGLLTFFLCLDDLFMLHEGIFPWHLRIPQTVVYVIYLILFGSFFLYYFKHIVTGEYIILLIALLFLGASAVGDFVLPQEGLCYFIEDTLKLFGIGTWFAYYFRYSLLQLL